MYANMYSHALVRALNVKTVNSLSRQAEAGAKGGGCQGHCDNCGFSLTLQASQIRGINHGSMTKINRKQQAEA